MSLYAIGGCQIAHSSHGQLPARAYERLRDLIVRGRLPAGARVVEAEAALMLGASRTPIREALVRLLQEGYLVAPVGGGRTQLVVAPLSLERMRELWSVIGALEGLAIEAIDRLPLDRRLPMANDMERLNRALRDASAQAPADVDALFEVQTSFHERFVTECAGPLLLAMYRSVRPHVERYEYWAYGAFEGRDLGPSTREHGAIIEAVRSGDARGAREAVETHWRNAAMRTARVVERAESSPDATAEPTAPARTRPRARSRRR